MNNQEAKIALAGILLEGNQISEIAGARRFGGEGLGSLLEAHLLYGSGTRPSGARQLSVTPFGLQFIKENQS